MSTVPAIMYRRKIGDNITPVSLTPVYSFMPVSHKVTNISANFRKNRKGQVRYSGPREKLIREKNLKSKISCQTLFNKLKFLLSVNDGQERNQPGM